MLDHSEQNLLWARSSMRNIYGTVFDNTGQPIFYDDFLELRPETKVTVTPKLYLTPSVTPRCVWDSYAR